MSTARKPMKRELRAQRRTVEKHAFSGKTLRTVTSKDGSRYRYLHATKGWRRRSSGPADAKPRYEGMLVWLFRRSVALGRA